MQSPTDKRSEPLDWLRGSFAVVPALSSPGYPAFVKKARSRIGQRNAAKKLVDEVVLALEPKGVVHVPYEERWVVPRLLDTDRLHFGNLEILVLAVPDRTEYRYGTPARSRSFK